MKSVIKTEQIPLIAAVLVIAYLMCKAPKKSSYAPVSAAPQPTQASKSTAGCSGPGCDMQAGGGLASSLLPKEVKQQEDYSQLKTDRLLEGQSFIHGMPGSVSGSLRNPNQQIRNDPMIERKPVSIFNQSTIVADRMRPKFEIGGSCA